MADKLNVAPTRGTLLRLQDELERIQEGSDLLDRTREVLTRELLATIGDAEAVQKRARERFQAAHRAICEARMHVGLDRLRWLTLAPGTEIDVEVGTHSIMGTDLPLVRVELDPPPLPYGPAGTSVLLDEARDRWLDVLKMLGDLAEVTLSVWRLAMELRKTQRRVNALEEVVIPRYEETVKDIAASLEEEEREDIVFAKRVKAQQ